MVCWLQQYDRSLSDWHGLEVGLETKRCRLVGQGTLQPTKIGRLSLSPSGFPELTCAKEVGFAQGDPSQPYKWAGPVDNGQEDAPEYEKVLVVDYTLVGREFTS